MARFGVQIAPGKPVEICSSFHLVIVCERYWCLHLRYNIRIENLSGERVQLRERHWRIYSLSGTLETVKGRGVVGQVSA